MVFSPNNTKITSVSNVLNGSSAACNVSEDINIETANILANITSNNIDKI